MSEKQSTATLHECLREAIALATGPTHQFAYTRCLYCEATWYGERPGRENPEKPRHRSDCVILKWEAALHSAVARVGDRDKLHSLLCGIVAADDMNSGAEPSISALYRMIDEARTFLQHAPEHIRFDPEKFYTDFRTGLYGAGWTDHDVATCHEHVEALEATVDAALNLVGADRLAASTVAESVPEGCTPTDAMVLREANFKLVCLINEIWPVLEEWDAGLDEQDGADYERGVKAWDEMIAKVRAAVGEAPSPTSSIARGTWDNDAKGAMAQAALQSCPKLGHMSTALKVVDAVLRSQSSYQTEHISPEICQEGYSALLRLAERLRSGDLGPKAVAQQIELLVASLQSATKEST